MWFQVPGERLQMRVEQQTRPEGSAAHVDPRDEILCHEPFAFLPVAQ
jgi:hypothetical protein